MRIIGKTNIDFLGRRRAFLCLSAALLVAGAVSAVMQGGLKFGVDFKGGTLVYVKFSEEPDVDRLRQVLTDKGLKVATLQPFDEGDSVHELKIDLDLAGDFVETSGKAQVIETLHEIYPIEAGKLDFNNAGTEVLAQRLMDNQSLRDSGHSSQDLQRDAESLIAWRDQAPRSGLVQDVAEFATAPGISESVATAAAEEVALGAFHIGGVDVVGPKIGSELQWQAIKATLFALTGMLVYIAFRFEWIYGVAAVIAVFHDVFITIGFFALFGREIELTVVAALLTLVGYSMNDTIVIFDRVRENRRIARRSSLTELLNLSINQTLSRTVLTSGLTLIAVVCLFVMGGEVLRGFSFALLVGVLVGTYSSIFVASPVLLWGRQRLVARSAGRAAKRA
ncbi:MAG: protein translocase subunit SecF [Bryobacterales bacterium]|nr:protein translocase subunit SecF [Bryobacterales bacterium]